MSVYPVVCLGDVLDINPRLSVPLADEDTVSFLGMADVSEGGTTNCGVDRPYKEVRKGYTPFLQGDILVAKITPCFQNGKIAQASTRNRIGFGSTEFHVLRSSGDLVEHRYLLHFLRQSYIRVDGERRMTGSGGQRRVPADYIKALKLPLPALEEQRRIASILDHADTLCAKRREAIARLDELTRSIFIDMFGEALLGRSDCEWVTMGDLCNGNFRNGLSPSKTGSVDARVLTLSAVTGNEFDGNAYKVSKFPSKPPLDQSVDENDLLICRGNGNRSLVGRGFFPSTSINDITFPDTIIAARVDLGRVSKSYLESVWNSPLVALRS
ncbi:restriction endonuclease subunit S [Rhodococcus sp. Chr-9]|uniref:restriction endonuclease subunit S n=1 Tax=Rhodococcus sp. Chr-9 TaxID=713612 RepID=UPI00126A6DEB|nr:restriction endonuclease subunit S [Rhodococcus sp. Chr-9]